MDRAASLFARLRLARRLAPGLLAGVPLFGIGCAGSSGAHGCSAAPASDPPAIQQTAYAEPAEPAPAPPAAAPVVPHETPISLDALLRIAEEHNARIGVAREKLHESMLIEEQSSNCWLPETYAGVAYYRHEGGIQDFNGNLIHSSTQALYPGVQIHSEIDLREATYRRLTAERQTWQQKAELSQLNSEILLEAASTYIDLLVAWRGAALAAELAQYDRDLLPRVENLAKLQPSAAGLVSGVQAALNNHELLQAKLKQQAVGASARLVYLLGMPPETCLVPVDPVLAPIDLVDAAPCQELLKQALNHGPGVRELEGMLSVIQEGLDRSYGIGNLLPSFQINAIEGLFGAGPGGSMTFDNRLDVCVQMRWNLTQLLGAESQRRLARVRQAQAMHSYEDLKGKLAAGVKEAREAILMGRQQITHSRSEIENADRSFKEGKKQFTSQVTPTTTRDLLQAIGGLQQAHLNYLASLSTHNKAQVRLLLLLGGGPAKQGPAPGPACHP